MSWRLGTESWSLTRRMAILFGVTTSLVVGAYAAWSAYYVFGTMRDDVGAFVDHEVAELALAVDRSEGSLEAVRKAVADIALVSEDPPCAFRVRDVAGVLVAEAGPPRLLEAITAPIGPDDSWRIHLVEHGVATGARRSTAAGFVTEVIVDANEALDGVTDYALAALVALLTSLVAAGVAGWFSAHRGLASLREVATQAGDIPLPAGGARIRLQGGPDEIEDLVSALNAMIERADGGLQRIRTFTAGLAHELRSPLQNLIGETEVALLRDRETDEYRSLLASNLEDLGDLSDAVDNLVAYCRITDANRTGARRERFDLGQELAVRLERELRSGERLGVEVVIRQEGDLTLEADREGCLRLARNLVNNAIHWTPSGGTVTVGVSGEPDAVRLVVEDEGPGVPEELEASIFEPFVSGGAPRGRRGGYGLGLAICRTVVTEHGGRIDVGTTTGGGARFQVELPRRPASADGTGAPPPTSTPATSLG